jgi:hypothetical protein
VRHRAPIDTGGGRATGETDLQIARQVIEKSGVLDVLTPLLETGVGRPRTLPLKASSWRPRSMLCIATTRAIWWRSLASSTP